MRGPCSGVQTRASQCIHTVGQAGSQVLKAALHAVRRRRDCAARARVSTPCVDLLKPEHHHFKVRMTV